MALALFLRRISYAAAIHFLKIPLRGPLYFRPNGNLTHPKIKNVSSDKPHTNTLKVHFGRDFSFIL